MIKLFLSDRKDFENFMKKKINDGIMSIEMISNISEFQNFIRKLI